MLAGSGNGRDGLALSESTRRSAVSLSVESGWTDSLLRPAPLAAAALHVARDRPFRACGRSPHRERPFRAKMDVPSTPAGIPVGCAPCGLSRSSAWCRLRCRAPHSGARSRRQSPWTRTRASGRTRAGISRWTLAPGGSARGAGWVTFLWRSRSRPRGRSRRRERERVDGSVGRCRRRTAMLEHRGVGRVSAFGILENSNVK